MEATRMTRTSTLRLRALFTACALMLGGAPSWAELAPPTPLPRVHTVNVFAAASLTAALQAVGAAFEQAHPTVTVQFNFAGSQTLMQQIKQGAPADVFASADEAHMQPLAE